MTCREEQAISPRAMLLLKGHENIGLDRGVRVGKMAGFWLGVAVTLIVEGIFCFFTQ